MILEGEVEVVKRMAGGEETALAVHGRGEFTGDVSLVTGSRVTAGARAIGPSRVCRLAAEDCRRVMVGKPGGGRGRIPRRGRQDAGAGRADAADR